MIRLPTRTTRAPRPAPSLRCRTIRRFTRRDARPLIRRGPR